MGIRWTSSFSFITKCRIKGIFTGQMNFYNHNNDVSSALLAPFNYLNSSRGRGTALTFHENKGVEIQSTREMKREMKKRRRME